MIEIDVSQALDFMNGAINGLANQASFLAEAGKIGKDAVKERIRDTKTDADGRAWQAWMQPTEIHRIARGTASQGLLWESGKLLDSINVKSGFASVQIGTSANYAGFLQAGTNHMSARPFMGWSAADEDHLHTAFVAWIDRAIGR
jgi:phage gpG-like protein